MSVAIVFSLPKKGNDTSEGANQQIQNDSRMSSSEQAKIIPFVRDAVAPPVPETIDAAKFKEDCLRFISTKISAKSMWKMRKELKKLKKGKNYFKVGKRCPLAAGLMHDIFCQSLD